MLCSKRSDCTQPRVAPLTSTREGPQQKRRSSAAKNKIKNLKNEKTKSKSPPSRCCRLCPHRPVVVYIFLDVCVLINLKATACYRSLYAAPLFSFFFLICFLKKKKKKKIHRFLALRCKFHILAALNSKFFREKA